MKKIIKGILLTVVIAVIVTFFLAMVCDAYVSFKGEGHINDRTAAEDGDCIVVLGAAVLPDGTVSRTLRKRLDMALNLYDDKIADKIIVSGDNGTMHYNEVEAMKKYLYNHGVPKENIFMDHAGFDSYSTVYRTRDIFLAKKPVFVTQKDHLVRTMYFANQLGLEAQGVACENYDEHEQTYQRIREYGARLKAVITCDVFHLKPKYLGDAIPVSGDGSATNE